MRVGELADRSGISASTVRYYEKLGLLRPTSGSRSGYREYTKESLDQLALIRRAKELGFSLREIRALLSRPRGKSREAVLAAVAAKLTQLERERKTLGSRERKLRDLRLRVLRDRDTKREGITEWLLRPDEATASVPLSRSSHGNFDAGAFRVINTAAGEAKRYRHNWIGTEHLLLGLVANRDQPVGKVLVSAGVDIAKIRKEFESFDFGPTTDESGIFITHRVQRVFGIAEGIAYRDHRRATADDLLLGILEDGAGVAVHLIRSCGGDPLRIAATLRQKLS